MEGLSLTDHAQSSDGYSSAKKAKNMSKYIRAVAGVLFVAVHIIVLVCTWGIWRGFRGRLHREFHLQLVTHIQHTTPILGKHPASNAHLCIR